jgi:glycosyltransferase involved in cell wall biosynthesis
MNPEPRQFHGPHDAGATPRLLLISYHFPPSPAAGALRWQKLAGFAAERGLALDVITLDPNDLKGPDWARLTDLPAGTRVFGLPQVELRRERVLSTVARSVRRLRRLGRPEPVPPSPVPTASPAPTGATAAPLPSPSELSRIYGVWIDYACQRRWSRWAVQAARALNASGAYRAVISCGPPHMTHTAGPRIGRALRIPFIMDLRDPWRLVERLADSIDTPLWRWLATWHERRVLPGAELVVVNTEAARDAMRRLYPRAASRIVAVMNGYDEETVPNGHPGDRFVVAYSGSIYLDRDPRPLFEAAARVIERRRLSPQEFGIVLVGNVAHSRGGSTVDLAREAGVADHLETISYRPRRETLEILARAAVLVSLPQDSHMAIPSKVFEYMQFNAWVLAMNEPGSATARLLEGSDASVISARDVEGLAAVLDRYYERFRRGERPTRLAADERFSRRHQAGILLDALESLVTIRS